MAQRLSDSGIARYLHKARKTLFHNLKSEKLRRIVNNKEQKRLNDSLLKAATLGRIKRVEQLLKLGADINTSNYTDGSTALILAARYGYTEVCALLTEKGANMEAKERFGKTPLIFAAHNGHIETCALLIAKGANIHAKDIHGMTALRYTKLHGRKETTTFLEFAHDALRLFANREMFGSFYSSFKACIQ